MNKRIWIRTLILMMLSTIWIVAGNVRLQVSSTQVAPGQSVRVKIIAEGSKVSFPAIQKIGSYPVERLNRSSKLEARYLNGKLTTKKQKILSFEFYPQKSVTIPSFVVDVDGKKLQTRSVSVKVVKGAQGSAAAGGFALRMSLSKKKVYLGEPVILTVDAVEPLNGNVAQMQYSPPTFKGFFSKPLGGEQRLQQGNRIIHRLRYLLIPQKPGNLSVTPAQVRIGIQDLNAMGDPFGIFGSALKWTALRSNAVQLTVMPLPAPADLVGDFQIKASVDKKKVQANMPVNYTLVIEGEGSLEDLEDPVFDIPGVTVYSDDAKVSSQVQNGRLMSRYVKKYVFISDRDFTIPALKLKEFDYRTGKFSTLSTPEIPVKVTGGSASAVPKGAIASPGAQIGAAPSTKAPAAKHTSAKAAKPRKVNPLTDEVYYAKKAYEEKARRFPEYLAAAFVAGMVLMFLLLRFWPKGKGRSRIAGKKGRHYSLKEALEILYPHINDDPEAERFVRLLYRVKQGDKSVEIDRLALDRLARKYDPEMAKKK